MMQEGKHNPTVEPWSKSDCHTNFFEVSQPTTSQQQAFTAHRASEALTAGLVRCACVCLQVPSRMVYLTDEDKRHVFNGLKPLLEDWAGGVSLKPTSCYGVRMYYNGSWLR